MDVEGSGDVCRYYAFILGALEVDKVIEIKVGYEDRVHPVSRINFPVIGVMELGHEIIPILDISLKLGIKETQNQSQTRTIIVVETVLNHQERKCGFRIDSLLDVMEVRPRDILETSLYQPDIKQFFISNQLSQCKEVIKILDIDTILAEIEQYFQWTMIRRKFCNPKAAITIPFPVHFIGEK